jgi:RecA/RadA recombinase
MSSATVMFNVLGVLLDSIIEALDQTNSGAPDRSLITTGSIAWDEADCGQLVVGVAQQYVTTVFPVW